MLLHVAASIAVAALTSASFAQPIQSNTIPVKNWALHEISDQSRTTQVMVAAGSTSGLVFIAITPCRVMDTRGQGGSGKTGQFGPPSLVAGQARMVPVPSSNCGVPVSAAYSMNFVSVSPLGHSVGWVAAWQDDLAWPGTVVLNAPQGGIVDNAAIVPAGADGGIQVQATDNCDLVIDLNGYFVQATTVQGPSGPQGPIGPIGPIGNSGAPGRTGPQGLIGNIGSTGGIGPKGLIGNTGAAGAAGGIGPSGLIGNTGAAGGIGPKGPTGNIGASGSIGPQGLTGNTGAVGVAGGIGPTGLIGNTGASGGIGPQGPAGSIGATGGIGAQGLIGNTGAAGAAGGIGLSGNTGASGGIGPQGPAGSIGATGEIGPQGVIGNTGAAGAAGGIGPSGLIGNTGASGGIGPQGPVGNIGATGGIGPQGPSGAIGPAGASGIMAFSDFYALMPPNNAATVAVGADVPFPQTGPTSSGGSIARASSSAFTLSTIGTYQVMFQVTVDEPGQLALTLNSVEQASTVVGRATGTNQIVGVSLVLTTVSNTVLTVRNPAGNSTALTFTPRAGGTSPVSAHLVITQIQ